MESWSEQAQILTGAGFRVIAIDFRGFGESRVSGQTDSYSPPTLTFSRRFSICERRTRRPCRW